MKPWQKLILFLPRCYAWSRLTDWYINNARIPHAVSYLVNDFTPAFWLHEHIAPFELWTPDPKRLLETIYIYEDKRQEFCLAFQESGNKFVPCTDWTIKNLEKNYDHVDLLENFVFSGKEVSPIVFKNY
ncbi:MAG: hypothetical protein NWE88_10680 [Candidatus Bathyarchaeota archaeon]|nr:hypothetical protein [Candidatus Bathyarchaeota archaeon]